MRGISCSCLTTSSSSRNVGVTSEPLLMPMIRWKLVKHKHKSRRETFWQGDRFYRFSLIQPFGVIKRGWVFLFLMQENSQISIEIPPAFVFWNIKKSILSGLSFLLLFSKEHIRERCFRLKGCFEERQNLNRPSNTNQPNALDWKRLHAYNR